MEGLNFIVSKNKALIAVFVSFLILSVVGATSSCFFLSSDDKIEKTIPSQGENV